jgi:hypothetical protein
MPTTREQWFADVLQAGLETHVLGEPDILAHATPAVLIAALPRDVMVRVLDDALSAGTISPSAVVKTATPALLAQHVAAEVVWACIAAAATRAGIPDTAGTAKDGAREFLRRVLDAGLRTTAITAKDLVQHVDAKVLGYSFPDALTTKLLEVSLASGKLTPEIVVDTLGIDAIAKHAPTHVMWACIAKAGEPAAKPVEMPPPKQKLEFVEDDVASVLVDLEEAPEMIVEVKPDDSKAKVAPRAKRA